MENYLVVLAAAGAAAAVIGGGYAVYQLFRLAETDARCRGMKHPRLWGLLASSGSNQSGLLLYLIRRKNHPVLSLSEEEKGLIHADTKVTLSAEGLCTLALRYDGAEIYWWDLENLDPESDEYQAYESLRTKGEINLYGAGTIIMPKKNGPFALLSTYYEGDVEALEKAFEEFGQEN